MVTQCCSIRWSPIDARAGPFQTSQRLPRKQPRPAGDMTGAYGATLPRLLRNKLKSGESIQIRYSNLHYVTSTWKNYNFGSGTKPPQKDRNIIASFVRQTTLLFFLLGATNDISIPPVRWPRSQRVVFAMIFGVKKSWINQPFFLV